MDQPNLNIEDFCAKGFNAKAWVNQAFSGGDSVEKRAGALAAKLQHSMFELSKMIEDLSGNCLMHIPGVLKEIDLLSRDAAVLQKTIDQFSHKLDALEMETKDSVLLVANLDDIKSKMESVRVVIVESEKYKNLMQNMDSIMENQSSEQIISSLSEMNQSVAVLKNIPLFASAEKNYESYVEKIDKDLKPKLTQALIKQDTENAIKYTRVYQQIGRDTQIVDLYCSCKSLKYENVWENVSKTPGKPFSEWLHSFYDELQYELTSELAWAAAVFPSSTSLVSMSFFRANQKIKSRFENQLDSQNLQALISLYTTTKDFHRSLLFLNALNITKEQTQFVTKAAIIGSIYAPYITRQLNYSNLQKIDLKSQLQAILPKGGDFPESIAAIDNSVPKLFILLETALQRCLDFTEGSEAEALISILSDTLMEYLAHLNMRLIDLRQMANLDPSKPGVKPKPQQASHNEHFHDWEDSYFQGALQLLEVVEKITSRLLNFEENVKLTLASQRKAVFGSLTEIKDLDDIQCYHIVDLKSAQRVFQFMKLLETPTFKLWPTTSERYHKYLHGAQTFVFDSMSSYIKTKINQLVDLPVWALTGNVPLLGIQPQGYIKLVVEHLIVLRQLLEPYDTNKALELDGDIQLSRNICASATDTLDLAPTESSHFEEDPGHVEPEGFAFHWISAVVSGTMALYFEKINSIPLLTPHGCMQLKVDIGHLFNVLTPLGIKPSIALQSVYDYVRMEESVLAEQLSFGTPNPYATIIATKRNITAQTKPPQ